MNNKKTGANDFEKKLVTLVDLFEEVMESGVGVYKHQCVLHNNSYKSYIYDVRKMKKPLIVSFGYKNTHELSSPYFERSRKINNNDDELKMFAHYGMCCKMFEVLKLSCENWLVTERTENKVKIFDKKFVKKITDIWMNCSQMIPNDAYNWIFDRNNERIEFYKNAGELYSDYKEPKNKTEYVLQELSKVHSVLYYHFPDK